MFHVPKILHNRRKNSDLCPHNVVNRCFGAFRHKKTAPVRSGINQRFAGVWLLFIILLIINVHTESNIEALFRRIDVDFAFYLIQSL